MRPAFLERFVGRAHNFVYLNGQESQWHRVVEIPTDTLAFTGQVPTASTNDDVEINVPAAVVSLTGQVPTASAPEFITAGTDSLVFTGQVPTVTNSANVTITPPTGVVALTGIVPLVLLEPSTINIPTATLVFTGQAPEATTTDALQDSASKQVVTSSNRTMTQKRRAA